MKTKYFVIDTDNKLVYVGTGYDTAIAWRNSLYPYSGVYKYDDNDANINIDDDDDDINSTDGLIWD
jgi:hypothetical protein